MARKPNDKGPMAPENPVVLEQNDPLAQPEPVPMEPAEPAPPAASAEPHGTALVEPDSEAIQRLEAQVAEWKDRALRGAADFDNFRKRAWKEREDAAARGQSEIVGKVIDVVDDLARVAHLDPATTSAQALHEGMLAIERKMMKMLETVGIERIDPVGQTFDPNLHEAVTTLPAPDSAQDDKVAQVFQPGYRFKSTLLRPARVAVYQHS